MGIKSIKITNLLSFDELIINDFRDINCIVGRNNVGKSNLMKLIHFFYLKLEGKRDLTPDFFSNYSSFGAITITYDTSRIRKIVTSDNRNKSSFFKHIYNVLFQKQGDVFPFKNSKNGINYFELTLTIHSNESCSWSKNDKQLFNIINYLYPFFKIETRHIDLYDWDKLWHLISRLKSFNVNQIKQEDIIKFFDTKLTKGSGGYSEYISKIQELTETSKYSYREKVLNYVKSGLKGQKFLINGEELYIQSDGTNSFKYVELFCKLLITLTRRDYITPTLYVDEPEVGLHPKRTEELIDNICHNYMSFKKTKKEREKGKYKTPYPKIIFATHSPNIVKQVIKDFNEDQQILHISRRISRESIVKKMNSTYKDKRFLNVFSDNEARLFFSDFILFVEGPTELELFSHKKLLVKFPQLKRTDIYASSDNVFSENINPSYANTSIPYLFLFDLDKLVDTPKAKGSGVNRKIILKNNGGLIKLKPLDLDKEIVKYKKGYNRKYVYIQQSLKKLKEFNNKEIPFDPKTFKYTNNEFETFIKLLESVASLKNIIFAKTTIEGTLINTYSKQLFWGWLKEEYNVKDLGTKILEFQNGGYGDEDVLIEYIRAIFGGKFEVLVTLKNIENGKKNNSDAKAALDYVKDMIISPKKKTSGWVTSFLNYSCSEIDKKNGKKFEECFPELTGFVNKIIV